MARSYSQNRFNQDQLRAKISLIFRDTPLEALGRRFEAFADTIGPDVEGGDRVRNAVGHYLTFLEHLLGSNFQDRFHLDSWLIRDVLDSWSRHNDLNQNVVPIYAEKQWSYTLLLPPEIQKVPLFEMYLVTFPGNDFLGDINLLKYPWLWHELGHHLLAKRTEEFMPPIAGALDSIAVTLSKKVLSDSAEVRRRHRSFLEDLKRFWKPTCKQYDWGHEIAVDVIALWTCGPAYLASFHDVVEDPSVDPFLVSTGHPPYEVRTRVLTDVADYLGWNREAKQLHALLRAWRDGSWAAKRDNNYLAFAKNPLVETAVAEVIKLCTHWQLPKCDLALVESAKAAYETATFSSATELVLAAWFAYEANPNDYEDWQSKAVKHLSDELKP